MRELDYSKYTYLSWKNIFKEDFLKKYENMQLLKQSRKDSNQIIEAYIDLFNSAIYTMRVFLANNGIFKSKPSDIIREFYLIEYINMGREWLEALTLTEFEDREFVKPMLLIYAHVKQYFQIFDELKNKLTDCINND